MTNIKGFSIKLGMTHNEFFNSNMEQLKNLSQEQKVKIANFWLDDEDHKVTNEVELAVLEGFTSRDGKVKMPEGNPSLFIKREYSKDNRFKDDYIDTFQSEAPEYKDSKLLINHYNHGRDVRVTWQHDSNANYIIDDTLCDSGDEMQRGGHEHTDELADGYADKRFIGYEDKKNHHTGLLMVDDDLNGIFECGFHMKNGLNSFIKKMFGK